MEATDTPRVGRPRAFDTDAALDTAMLLFWRKGYDGTSLSDLTDAIGVNRPSLYAAFGNKEALFRKAFDRYVQQRAPTFQAALAQPTARAVAASLLHAAADYLTCPESPGCFAVSGSLTCSEDAPTLHQELTTSRESVVTALRLRFEHAQATNDLPPTTNPADLARYLSTVINGMAVEATSGTPAPTLHRIATLALHAWPPP